MERNFRKELSKLIKSKKTCVIGSIDSEGNPSIKAMLRPRKITGSQTFYFASHTSAEHVRQYLNNPRGSLLFYKKAFGIKGILLKGIVEVLSDADAKRMLWEKGDEKFFPGGVDDPDYCVMKFVAYTGCFYSKSEEQVFPIEDTTGK